MYKSDTNLDYLLEDYCLTMRARGQVTTSPSGPSCASLELNQSVTQITRA